MSDRDRESSAMEYGLRRLIATEANRKHLRAMPVFHVDTDMHAFDSLLEAMDRAETKRQSRN